MSKKMFQIPQPPDVLIMCSDNQSQTITEVSCKMWGV